MKYCELFLKSLFEIQVSLRQTSSKRCGLFSSNSTKLTKLEVLLLILRCMIQGRIQTTSTYASAEATSAVVKLFKEITEYPFSPKNYFILFFCRSKRLRRLRPRYAVVILQNLSNVFACLPCGKNYFTRKYSKIQ